MLETLIDTGARRILNRGKDINKRQTVLRMLQDGELSIEKTAKYLGLIVAEVEDLVEV